MPGASKLFDLIQSLSKSEKRYFRMRASFQIKGEKNQYLLLFESMERQRAYDEAALLEELRGTAIGEHFSEAKYYLYQSILKALHAFHAEESLQVRVQTLIHQCRILIRRGLHDHAPPLLAKARKLAEGEEEWGLMREILSVEYDLLLLDVGLPELRGRMEELFATMRRYHQLEGEHLSYWGHFLSMFTAYRVVGLVRSERELAPFRAMMEEGPAQAGGLPRTMKASIYYYQSIALYSDLNHDSASALEAHLAILRLLRDSPTCANGCSPTTFFNICVAALRAQRYDIFLEYYPELMRAVNPRGHGRPFRQYLHARGLAVYFLCLAGYFDEAMAETRRLEEEARERGKELDDHETTLAMISYFGGGDYSRALDYLNGLLGLRNKRENIQMVARAFALIIHFELGRFDLLEYLLKSTYKYLLSKERLFGFERAIMECIRGAMAATSDAARTALFAALQEKLEAIMNDPFERAPMEMVDILAWLESKRTGRRFADVVRDNFRARHGDIAEKIKNLYAWQSAA